MVVITKVNKENDTSRYELKIKNRIDALQLIDEEKFSRRIVRLYERNYDQRYSAGIG